MGSRRRMKRKGTILAVPAPSPASQTMTLPSHGPGPKGREQPWWGKACSSIGPVAGRRNSAAECGVCRAKAPGSHVDMPLFASPLSRSPNPLLDR